MKKLFSEIPYLIGERIVLKRIEQADAPALQDFVDCDEVYRYLPDFLFERKYKDINTVISRLYDECFKESIILGVFLNDKFCGLAEIYGYKEEIHKASVGCRLAKDYWGMGIACEVAEILTDYLYNEAGIEIITASSMVENKGSAAVLRKCGFTLVVNGVEEDWGYEKPTIVDKWIR